MQNFFLLLVTCYLLLVTAPAAQAQTMSNKDYIIRKQDLNTISGELSNSTSEGVNFKIKSGFQNAPPSLPFSVSLSSDLIDFGMLSPTNPIVRTVDLSVYSLSSSGYAVIVSENHTLKSDKDSIPDTTCDNGECSHENAGAWTNTLSFGFGYRCDNITGTDCDSLFSNQNYYKHFANTAGSQLPQSVMSGIGSKTKDVRLSYKVNVSGNHAQGTYSNVITFIAVPNF